MSNIDNLLNEEESRTWCSGSRGS